MSDSVGRQRAFSSSVGVGLDLLAPRERRLGVVLAIAMVGGGAIETLAAAGVLLLIRLVVQPEELRSGSTLRRVYEALGAPEPRAFILVLGIAILCILGASAALNWLLLYAQNRYVASVQQRLAQDLFERCIRAPYSWFLSQNYTLLFRMLYEDASHWSSFMQRIVGMGGHVINIAMALLLLVAFSSGPGLLGAAVVGALASAGYLLTKPVLSQLSIERFRAKERTAVTARHALDGIKEVRLSSREKYLADRFAEAYRRSSRTNAMLAVWRTTPSLILVAVGQLGLVGVLVIQWWGGAPSGEIAAQLALLLIVTAKAIPAATGFSGSLADLWASFPSIHAMRDLLDGIDRAQREEPRVMTSTTSPAIWHSLRCERVSYRYPQSQVWALRDVSLTMERGKAYAIVGRSGAGKSTLVDVLVGLLRPTEGAVILDTIDIADVDLRSWQCRIGYVAQAPYILDDTCRANVAFGLPPYKVDDARVLECLRIANLDDLLADLQRGLDTRLAERGQRLSGGQRQRIAIARALYNDPEVLVFDEATSAIDQIGEREILRALENVRSRVTLITIAHRLATVMRADSIFLLDRGRHIATGTFEELLEREPLFREMAA